MCWWTAIASRVLPLLCVRSLWMPTGCEAEIGELRQFAQDEGGVGGGSRPECARPRAQQHGAGKARWNFPKSSCVRTLLRPGDGRTPLAVVGWSSAERTRRMRCSHRRSAAPLTLPVHASDGLIWVRPSPGAATSEMAELFAGGSRDRIFCQRTCARPGQWHACVAQDSK